MHNFKAIADQISGTDSPSTDSSTAVTTQSSAPPFVPTYAGAFRCIGQSCEDPCCDSWDIPVDTETYKHYREFHTEKLGSEVSQFVHITHPGQPSALHATIHRTPSGLCPFFGVDHLCKIQKEYGQGLLSATCSIYPRSLSWVEGRLEGSLNLSCPEAARNVLLNPDFLQSESNLHLGDFRTDNTYRVAYRSASANKLKPYFHTIRSLLVDIVKSRSTPIWHRLLMIGSLCNRMDQIASTKTQDEPSAILEHYRHILADKRSVPELEGLPTAPGFALSVAFALSDARMRDNPGKRFKEVFLEFVQGISSFEEHASPNDVKRFSYAEKVYYRPFLEHSPFVLENYLVNYLFKNLFPFGRLVDSGDSSPRSIFDEYVLMATQFAWVNALLIGISGHQKECFSGIHVVKAIQAFAREVEHYPGVLQSINTYIRSRGLDNLQGMSMILRA